MDMQEFLTRLKNKKISSLEVRNFTEEITNNYELGKLRLLHYEMETFFYHTPFTPKEVEYFSKHIVFLAKKIKRVEHESFFKRLIEEPGFDTFIEEMQTLKVNVSFHAQRDRFRKDGKERCYLDLSHYSQDDRAYRNHLGRVQQVALTEVSKLNDEQIKRQLKRLSNIQKRLLNSIHFYMESHKEFDNGILDQTEFKYRLAKQFIFEAPEYYEHGIITNEFMFHLHDAIAFKEGCISSFIEQIKQTNTTDEEEALTLLQKAFNFQTLLDDLTAYQLHIIENVVTKELFRIEGLATVIMGENSNHKYPDTVSSREDKITYWQYKLWDKFNKTGLELPYKELDRFQKKLIKIYEEKYLKEYEKQPDSENEENKGIDKKPERLKKLANQYCNRPHSLYNVGEVLFILKKADELKHQKNVSALIRNIQNDEHCPDSIKDKGKFNHSNKHVKRQRKVIEFYDKETGNKRK